MPDRVRIKVCGLTTLEAIEAAIEAGVDAVGVVLSASPRRVTVDRAAELLDSVPEHVLPVAVYKHPERALVGAAVGALPPRVMHQSDATDFEGALSCVRLEQRVPVVRTVDGFETAMRRHEGRLVLIEGAHSGAGQLADWHRAAGWMSRADIMIAGGLHTGNVGGVVRDLRPFAVDVSSGVESSPGIKDPTKIRAFVAAVREAQTT